MKTELKPGDKVVMLHPEKYRRKEELRGVIWTIRKKAEFLSKPEYYLEGFLGTVSLDDLIQVFPQKRYCHWQELQSFTVTNDQYESVAKYIREKGIMAVENRLETWWGGKDCVEFKFLSRSNEIMDLLEFTDALD